MWVYFVGFVNVFSVAIAVLRESYGGGNGALYRAAIARQSTVLSHLLLSKADFCFFVNSLKFIGEIK